MNWRKYKLFTAGIIIVGIVFFATNILMQVFLPAEYIQIDIHYGNQYDWLVELFDLIGIACICYGLGAFAMMRDLKKDMKKQEDQE